MKALRWFSAVLATCFALSAPAQVGGPTLGGAAPSFVRLIGGGIPFIHAPTGTMANNGVATLGTALSRTIPSAWMWLPAGAVATGVPAAASWLYAQCSSTTVCTISNNTYTTGSTAPPASPTAFVTTGPGAFTGDITTATGPNVTVTAGAMGALGVIHSEESVSNNNSAGAKTWSLTLGSTTFWNISQTTAVAAGGYVNVSSQGDATHQMGDVAAGSFHPIGATAAGVYGTENTANALTLAHKIGKAVATDVAIIERYNDWLVVGAP